MRRMKALTVDVYTLPLVRLGKSGSDLVKMGGM